MVTYMARFTEVGQSIMLTVLCSGKQESVKLTLAARPGSAAQAGPAEGGKTGGA